MARKRANMLWLTLAQSIDVVSVQGRAPELKATIRLLASQVKNMSWNYRVMKKAGRLAVYSVYYDDNGAISGWSEIPFSPEADNLEDLRATLELMLDALTEEILEPDSVPEQS